VSQRTHIQAIQSNTSQPLREAGLLLALADPELELCSSPSTSLPRHRFFAWQGAEDDGERTVWLTHRLLLQPDWWETKGYGPTAARLHRHPERRAVLHASVSVQRHPSSYFPCSPSVTRLGADPAPHHPSTRKQRAGDPDSADCELLLFLDSSPNQVRWVPFQKMQLLPWERGTSRRFAQECPEGNPGKYKQGETQWHSTKTKSL
jgi:hypothetical protein